MDANLAKAMEAYGLGNIELGGVVAEHYGEIYLRLVAVEPPRVKLVFNDSPATDPDLAGLTLERAVDGRWASLTADRIRDRGTVDGVGQLEWETDAETGFAFAGTEAEELSQGFARLRSGLKL